MAKLKTTPPESLDKFLAKTGITIDSVSKISGIDKLHLMWALQGLVELDEAHLQRLEETIPNLDTRALQGGSSYQPPLLGQVEKSDRPADTRVTLIEPSKVRAGDYLRYLDEKTKTHYWVLVEEVEKKSPTATTVMAKTSGTTVILENTRPVWAAVPVEKTDEEKDTSKEDEQ